MPVYRQLDIRMFEVPYSGLQDPPGVYTDDPDEASLSRYQHKALYGRSLCSVSIFDPVSASRLCREGRRFESKMLDKINPGKQKKIAT